jgi:hypothetical protein
MIISKKILPVLILPIAILSGCGGDSTSPTPDVTPPVVTLTGDAAVNIEVFTTFSDPGVSAIDDIDGSVAVTVTGAVDTDVLGDYVVTYTAADAAGNSTSVSRTFSVVDTTAPVITLKEDASFVLEVGNEYREYGASAIDNLDGEVAVEITSNVDTGVVGQYEVVYRSVDSMGNTGSVTRPVTVNQRKVLIVVDKFGDGSANVSQGPTLDCSGSFDCTVEVEADETVILNAIATDPWQFVSWRGCDEVEGLEVTQCSITPDSDSVVSLTFAPNEQGYDMTLNDGAIELSEELKAEIVDYNASSGVLTFSRNADLTALTVGTIIASTGTVNSDGIRDGFFLKRVEEVLGNNNSLRVIKTSEATVTDLVKEGTFVWQQVLSADDVDVSALPAGLTLVNDSGKEYGAKSSKYADLTVVNNSDNESGAKSSTPIEFLATNLVLYDRDGNINTKEDQISLTGGFKLYVNPDFALDVDFPATLKEFRSIAYIDLNTEAGLDIGGLVNFPERTLRVLSVDFAPIPLGPIVLVPAVELNIVFRAGVGGVIKPRIVAKTDIVAGARYSSAKGWEGVSDLDFNVSVNDWTESVEFKAQATVGPEMEFITRLYGVTGPKISAKAVVGVEALPVFNSKLCVLDVNTFIEATAGFGADFRILTKRFDYTVDLIKVKKIINSLSRECGGGAPNAPEELVVTQGADLSLDLEWLSVGDGAEITYKVIKDNVGIESDILASNYSDKKLTVGIEYCYKVVATDDTGAESPPSAKVCATVSEIDEEIPTMPLTLVATPLSSSGISLAWTTSTDNVAVTGYTVYMEESGTSRPIKNITTASDDVLSLVSDTEYCFTVSAFDAEGNVSDLSAPACATTLSSDSAKWTMFIKCTDRSNYVVEDSFDLDEEYTSDIFVFGSATDYGGGEMYYNLFGDYDDETNQFSGEINWSFEQSSNLRKDAFTADLSLNDTGDIEMTQLKVTGCDASVKFVNQEAPESAAKKSSKATVDKSSKSSIEGFGSIGQL